MGGVLEEFEVGGGAMDRLGGDVWTVSSSDFAANERREGRSQRKNLESCEKR